MGTRCVSDWQMTREMFGVLYFPSSTRFREPNSPKRIVLRCSVKHSNLSVGSGPCAPGSYVADGFRLRMRVPTHKILILRDVLPTISESTRVTEKGQATIPKELREKYDLDLGDEVVWIDTDEGIVVKKRTLTGACGLLVPDDTPDEKRGKVADELSQRLRDRRDQNYEGA